MTGIPRREFLVKSLATLVLGLGFGRRAACEEKGGIGGKFMEETGLTLSGALKTAFRFRRRPPLYKRYPGKELIPLPEPVFPQTHLARAIQERRSIRDYARRSLELEELSALLFAASGITGNKGGYLLRASPSAGALYPIEIYPFVHKVDGLRPGLYHYSVEGHALALLEAGDYREHATAGCLFQEMAGEAAVTFALSAIFARVCWKYGERGYRYALIEAGHIGQNVYLAATSLHLGCVSIGAFLDGRMNALLEIDGKEEAAIYCIAVGER